MDKRSNSAVQRNSLGKYQTQKTITKLGCQERVHVSPTCVQATNIIKHMSLHRSIHRWTKTRKKPGELQTSNRSVAMAPTLKSIEDADTKIAAVTVKFDPRCNTNRNVRINPNIHAPTTSDEQKQRTSMNTIQATFDDCVHFAVSPAARAREGPVKPFMKGSAQKNRITPERTAQVHNAEEEKVSDDNEECAIGLGHLSAPEDEGFCYEWFEDEDKLSGRKGNKVEISNLKDPPESIMKKHGHKGSTQIPNTKKKNKDDVALKDLSRDLAAEVIDLTNIFEEESRTSGVGVHLGEQKKWTGASYVAGFEPDPSNNRVHSGSSLGSIGENEETNTTPGKKKARGINKGDMTPDQVKRMNTSRLNAQRKLCKRSRHHEEVQYNCLKAMQHVGMGVRYTTSQETRNMQRRYKSYVEERKNETHGSNAFYN